MSDDLRPEYQFDYRQARPNRFGVGLIKGGRMTLTLSPDLETALIEQARQKGLPPEALALDALRERFLPSPPAITPQDEWERRLLGAASDCGVSLPHSALSSDGLYE